MINGAIMLNGKDKAPLYHFALFKNDGENVTVKADEDSIILVLSGEPVDEPIASYGPFLMNNQEEIRQAFDDYNEGKFGFLDEN